MSQRLPYRFTAFVGILLYALVLLEIPFYFVYTPTASGTPPATVILARILIDLFVCLGLLAFFSGFKSIMTLLAPEKNWIAQFIYSCGIIFAGISFVADSIQAGSLWAAGNNPVNPTAVGYGADGALLIYGPINRLLNTTILFCASWLIFKTTVLPKWLGIVAVITGIYNLAFIPTIFFMTTPMDFYSVNGWNIPIAAGMFFLWILLTSFVLLRKASRLNSVRS